MSGEEPHSPAFQQLTANNHGPGVIVASYIFLVISIIVVITRLVTRLKITRKFSLDDYVILASTLLAIAQTITVTVAVNHGLGRHRDAISNSQFEGFAKAFYAARVLAILVLALAKSSTNLLILGIHPPKPIKIACQVTLAVTNVWALAAMLAIIFECDLPQVWAYQGQCVNQWALDLANTVWNITTDIALVLLPFFLMRNVQVSATKRWVVIALFGCRIIVPAFAVAGAVAASDYWNATSPADPTWYAVKSSLWSQAVINLSIITACIPCIKRFLADLSSGMMGANISEPLELTMKNVSSSGRLPSRTGNGGFLRSKLFSRTGGGKSQHTGSYSDDYEEKRSHSIHPQFTPGNNHTKIMVERSESTKGLTEGVILQTIDYDVREETRTSGVWDGSQDSHRQESRPSHGSSPTGSRIGAAK